MTDCNTTALLFFGVAITCGGTSVVFMPNKRRREPSGVRRHQSS